MINCWDNIEGDGRGLPEPGRGGKGRGFWFKSSRQNPGSISGTLGISAPGHSCLVDRGIIGAALSNATSERAAPFARLSVRGKNHPKGVTPESPRPSLPDPDLSAAGARRNRGKNCCSWKNRKMQNGQKEGYWRDEDDNPTHFKPVIQLTQSNPPYTFIIISKIRLFLTPLLVSVTWRPIGFKISKKPPETHAE